MSVHYHPFSDPRMEIDVRACLVEALARALERRCGGNPVLNRLEAEACADRFISSDGRESSRIRGAAAMGPAEGAENPDIGADAERGPGDSLGAEPQAREFDVGEFDVGEFDAGEIDEGPLESGIADHSGSDEELRNA